MWRVQTEGYTEGTGQLVGIVSRDAGFLDSPDVEWISGGVNTKGPNAVALGRHGNFFHWGFAASPTYLTEEAKLVFVNALHYIARFDGETPVARKQQGVLVRSDVESMIESISDEGYARTLAMYAEIREDDAARKAEIRARIEAGEEVSDLDRRIADSPPPRDPGRFDRVRRLIAPDVWSSLGEDPERVARHLRANLPYMHPTGEWYSLAVDEELKRFGVANDDPALLERAVAALAGDGAGLARTLLARYTEQAFESQAEWTAWLAEHEDRLFFSEAAGYKWLVARRALGSEAPVLEPTAQEPAVFAATLRALGGGRHELTVHARILEGWHAYDEVGPGVPYVPLSLELELPNGWVAEGVWTRPDVHVDPTNPRVTLLEGELAYRRVLVAPDAGEAASVVCAVRYQVCDASMCLPPAQERLTAALQR